MPITPGMSAPAATTRYRSLDAWRGVACLLVVLFHSVFYIIDNPAARQPTGALAWVYVIFRHGYTGVGIFFVISGYCIAATCDSTRRRGAPVGQYFLRRLRRIYPPYLIVLALTAAAVWVLPLLGQARLVHDDVHAFRRPETLGLINWIGNATLTEQWRSNVVSPKTKWMMGQAWTLGYEEQFYIVCGLTLLVMRRRFFATIFTLTGLLAAMSAYQFCTRSLKWTDGFFFDSRWLLFAAGLLVFYRIHYAPGRRGRPIDVLLLMGLLGAVFIVRHRPDPEHIDRMVGFAFAFVALSLYRWDDAIMRSRWARPMLFCGQMCYSMYLVHMLPVKIVSRWLYDAGCQSPLATLVLTVPICVLVSLAMGRVFYLGVERRFLNTSRTENSAENSPAACAARLSLGSGAYQPMRSVELLTADAG